MTIEMTGARRLVAVVIALAMTASACGGGSAADTVAANPPEPTSQSEPTATPAETPPPEEEAAEAEAEEEAAEEEAAEPDQTEPDESEDTGSGPDEVEETAEATAVSFYDSPGQLQIPLPLAPAEPGTIIDSEELTIVGAEGLRIAYHSTATNGDDVAVTGFAMWPTGDPPEDGWPLVSWAHGTTGLGDGCAPSHDAENDLLARALVTFGFAVVATDYEGLGTPGVHPYVVGPSEAFSVLDSVRAVQQQLELPFTDAWVAFGHSQGGHAAMFTGQLHPTYAPELNLIGVVAGAPPSQQAELGAALIGGDFQGYTIMTAAGLAAAYDNLDIADVLTPAALDLIDVVETGCTSDIFATYNPIDYDEIVEQDPFDLPAWTEVLLENDTNRLPVEVPLLIIHGGEDEQIPVETSATLLTQLCAFENQGPTVRNVYPGQSHGGVLTTFAAVPDLQAWVMARFADEAAPDQCRQ